MKVPTLDGVRTLLRVTGGRAGIEDRQIPATVVTTGAHRELRRYGPQVGSDPLAPPVLLVPPLAVSARCYDLGEDLSVVETLIATGRVPYVVDFGDMTYADRHLGFEDFFGDIVPAAMADVLADHPGDHRTVDLIAWSLGGTVAFMTAAADRTLPIRSITAIGTPLDYSVVSPYPLVTRLVRPTRGKAVTAALHAMGGIPAPLVRAAYRATAWQREIRKPAYILRNADDRAALTRMSAIDRFQTTMPGYPGRLSEQMWESLIYRGELAAGVLHIAEQRLDLTAIEVPIQLFGSHRDAIVSWQAAHHGVDLFRTSAAVYFDTVETSHLGLIAGDAARGQTWPRVDEFLRSL